MVIRNTQKLTYGFSDLFVAPRYNLANPQLPAREVFVLGMFLAFLQVMDGWFTSMGINQFGIGIEGNPLLRDVMIEFGHVPTLTVVKLISIILVVTLTVYSRRVPWVKNAMGAVTGFYLFAAIIPWTYILFIHPV